MHVHGNRNNRKDRVKYLSGLKMLESFSKDDKQKAPGAGVNEYRHESQASRTYQYAGTTQDTTPTFGHSSK